ncbi:uncharacterized protein LOC110184968 [Drosophila serrata]|uniref:uncharacterized protein LOC110184968 n=1 Tax=Drosophila serrata TaxID=7274 RepID=UPI000A1CFF7B|nr:uncharacterized protein LOC110184968 [Drosophila serrata]
MLVHTDSSSGNACRAISLTSAGMLEFWGGIPDRIFRNLKTAAFHVRVVRPPDWIEALQVAGRAECCTATLYERCSLQACRPHSVRGLWSVYIYSESDDDYPSTPEVSPGYLDNQEELQLDDTYLIDVCREEEEQQAMTIQDIHVSSTAVMIHHIRAFSISSCSQSLPGQEAMTIQYP